MSTDNVIQSCTYRMMPIYPILLGCIHILFRLHLSFTFISCEYMYMCVGLSMYVCEMYGELRATYYHVNTNNNENHTNRHTDHWQFVAPFNQFNLASSKSFAIIILHHLTLWLGVIYIQIVFHMNQVDINFGWTKSYDNHVFQPTPLL